MVKKQMKEDKLKKRRKRRLARERRESLSRKDGLEDEETTITAADERTRLMKRRKKSRSVFGWCSCFGQRSKSAYQTSEDEDSDASASEDDDEDQEGSETGDLDLPNNAGVKSKSEMTVLFGRAPWRWFKPNYWRYRVSRSRAAGRVSADEEERYIDGSL